eukprot:Rhum_TRINITY_DN14899_c8_g1::Rhum_TRINITY_DN14899_c8_g1_i2::g.125533::m.125533
MSRARSACTRLKVLLPVTDSHAACGSGGGGDACGSRDAGTHGGSVFVSCRSGERGGLARGCGCCCCCGFAGGEDTAEPEGWCAKTTTRSETLIVCEEGVPSAGAAAAGWTMPVLPRPRGGAAAAAAAVRCCCCCWCCLRASAPRRRKPDEDLRRGASSGEEADDDSDTERDDGSDAVPRNDRDDRDDDDDADDAADEKPRDRDDEKECRRRRRRPLHRRSPRGSARRCPLPALTLPPALPCPVPRAGLTGFTSSINRTNLPLFVESARIERAPEHSDLIFFFLFLRASGSAISPFHSSSFHLLTAMRHTGNYTPQHKMHVTACLAGEKVDVEV